MTERSGGRASEHCGECRDRVVGSGAIGDRQQVDKVGLSDDRHVNVSMGSE